MGKKLRTIGGALIGGVSAFATAKELFRDKTKQSQTNTRFSVNSFKSKISDLNGIMKTNRFLVTFSPPEWMALEKDAEGSTFVKDSLMFLCDGTQMPGLQLTTSETKRHGTGQNTFYPTSPIYNELPMTFIGDGEGKVMQFFHKWLQNIILLSEHSAGAPVGKRGALPFELFYKEEYVSSVVSIMFFDTGNNNIIEYKLHKAWPSNLSAVTAAWGSEELTKIEVSFRYDAWTSNFFDPLDPVGSLRPLSTIQKLIKSGTIIQAAIGGFKVPQNVGDALNVALNTKLIVDNFNF